MIFIYWPHFAINKIKTTTFKIYRTQNYPKHNYSTQIILKRLILQYKTMLKCK